MTEYTDLRKSLGGHAPVKIGVYALVADLPAAHADLEGAIVYCSDALAASETTGNGTGNIGFCNSTPAWVRIDTGAALAA